MSDHIVIITDETAAELIDQICRLFGRAIEEDGRLADADDAMDDLCDQVAERVIATFASLAPATETSGA